MSWECPLGGLGAPLRGSLGGLVSAVRESPRGVGSLGRLSPLEGSPLEGVSPLVFLAVSSARARLVRTTYLGSEGTVWRVV